MERERDWGGGGWGEVESSFGLRIRPLFRPTYCRRKSGKAHTQNPHTPFIGVILSPYTTQNATDTHKYTHLQRNELIFIYLFSATYKFTKCTDYDNVIENLCRHLTCHCKACRT